MTAAEQIEAEAREMGIKELTDLHLAALGDPRPEAADVAVILEKVLLDKLTE